jgi:ubiquinone/menaquinone biosynthesis C-methylase UbiE
MKLPKLLKDGIRACLRLAPAVERRLLVSAGYRPISRADAERRQAGTSGWKSGRSAAWQQSAYDRLLQQMSRGEPRLDLRIAAEAVDEVGLAYPTLLEVGCGGGYHSAILASLCRCEPQYRGSDFSSEMIEAARERFTGVIFEQADTTALPYASDAFDIVFDGVSLMHILDYRRAIEEVARVARSHAIFHCVPVFDDGHKTQYLFKFAYGEPVTEAVYNREELESAMTSAGLEIRRSWNALQYDVFPVVGSHSHGRTYLCRKVAR